MSEHKQKEDAAYKGFITALVIQNVVPVYMSSPDNRKLWAAQSIEEQRETKKQALIIIRNVELDLLKTMN